MDERQTVRSFDVDDTLINRGPLLRAFGLAAEKAKRSGLKPVTTGAIQQMTHTPEDLPIRSVLERLSLLAHSRRTLLDGVGDAISANGTQDGVRNIVNTGRSNKLPWAKMTWNQFEQFGLDPYFEQYAFKPHGATSTASKLDVIRSLLETGSNVEHYEDDPRTAYSIARAFPDVAVYLVHHKLTMQMVNIEQLRVCPNLHVVTHIREALTHKSLHTS